MTNNKPVLDFLCLDCQEAYELKSQKGVFGRKITDGAYSTMMKRLLDNNNPNLILLNYSLEPAQVTSLTVVPKHFLVPELIERRNPLATSARRAGWIGCNIVLEGIPPSGRIRLIEAGGLRPRAEVIADWRRVQFLSEQRHSDARGWIVHVMRCIEGLGRDTFSIADIYRFEEAFRQIYPANQHIRPKLRQQLQHLRNAGYLDFLGHGSYKLRQATGPMNTPC